MARALTVEQLRERDRARIDDIVDSLGAWPGEVVNSHRSAGTLYHRLEFLADIGVKESDHPSLPRVLDRVMEDPDPDGPFRVVGKVSEAYGGTGIAKPGWALCDTPILAYAVAEMGRADDARVRRAIAPLRALALDRGWPCAVSPELGKWRGPGRKGDPCPYATLAMLKALSAFDDLRGSPEAVGGALCLLDLWERSRDLHPYMFFMGTDFRKLKAPFVWYDLLHVAEVLSRIPAARGDPRFRDMLALIRSKADAEGRYTPESVWTAWKDWDFGQKKVPSDWMDALVARTLARADRTDA